MVEFLSRFRQRKDSLEIPLLSSHVSQQGFKLERATSKACVDIKPPREHTHASCADAQDLQLFSRVVEALVSNDSNPTKSVQNTHMHTSS